MMPDWILSPARLAGVGGLLVAYAALCARVAWTVRRQRLDVLRDNDAPAAAGDSPAVLVAYASQTGQAESLAHEATRMLRESDLRVTLLPVDAVTANTLGAHPRSLWLVSTTGEGDAPDHALGFVQNVLTERVDLTGHEALVLALGDREYRHYCAFGERLQQWLTAQGAKSEWICVDNMSCSALRLWQSGVSALRQELLCDAQESRPGPPVEEEWLLPPEATIFRLARRTLLNAGSQGGALYQLDFVVNDSDLPHWQSGDLASLCLPADPEHARDYSIASIPADGELQLLVRQSTRADGSPGVASNWLCTGMNVGDSVALTIRQHSSFRLGDNANRPLILIGNGSGLAGLLSHMRARIAGGQGEQWLLFGERYPAHDAILGEQLRQWMQRGRLARLDLAWSRGSGERTYVQDVLLQQADVLKTWVERGAAIYVCGSRQGMGQGVHHVLTQILGDEGLRVLSQSGRYRRDVY
ncbi:flavodoxin domain-containing protein [Diaphorobacter aerolatus]|uniref:NADPH--hemoprotein reductase n=2 Tax=Diaphorobacter aerolatus TaxID=1288495 RepID=A0A7H0GPY3_9BURK|nr:flavodoxin domain-containing protein [Diaphorobacter aerolatus]